MQDLTLVRIIIACIFFNFPYAYAARNSFFEKLDILIFLLDHGDTEKHVRYIITFC